MEYKRYHPYRLNEEVRNRNAEVHLHVSDFIYPLFVREGISQKVPVEDFCGVYHHTLETLVEEVERKLSLGIDKFLLFGIPSDENKSELAEYAYAEGNIVYRSVRRLKEVFPEVTLFTDVCLCSYTTHGHCGILVEDSINNDATIEILGKVATCHAAAGADFVAPSAMMDGQVWAIRQMLNREGYNTKILAYAAKYASAFYGPFRTAAISKPAFGDRKSYQLDCRTISQGISEIESDIAEGADWIMIKPAHTYLDMILRAKQLFPKTPVAGYHVSGEYMMLNLLSSKGLADWQSVLWEVHYAIKRSGADYIISYAAPLLAQKLQNNTN
ncbi:MAG: porphobilinogen synthase [Bacteroidales bacterium]|nr:porphobilinogen synthase [Bacteroidales bacterium]